MALCNKSGSLKLPKVYFWLWHPLKTWTDILIGLFISLLLPPFRLSKYIQRNEKIVDVIHDHPKVKEARIEHAVSVRSGMNKMVEVGLSSNKSGGFYKWSKLMKCDIVEVVISIPRNDAILQEWKIIDPSEVSMMDTTLFPSDPNITLYVTFPINILPHTIVAPTKKNQFGCVILDDCHDILMKLPKHIPISVFFHGGGLTIGTPRMNEQLDLLLTKPKTDAENSQGAMKPFIYISIDYSLAPEYTFPVQPIEACSVISYLLNLEYKLQVGGVSAGAYLALVAVLEAFRVQHPHRSNIKSVILGCPMLSPATDTRSFYQNETSSHACPVHFLRWCYRSYLDLPEPNELPAITNHIYECDDMLTILLGQNSTRSEYHCTPWYQSTNFRRLLEPDLNVPLTLGTDSKVPQFIISTNKADPLHDGGINMIDSLRVVNKSIVVHHDDFGSHFVGTTLDSAAYQKLVVATQEAIARM